MQGQSFLIFKFVGKLYSDTGAVALEQSGLFSFAVGLSRALAKSIGNSQRKGYRERKIDKDIGLDEKIVGQRRMEN